MTVLRMNAQEFARYHRRLAEQFKPTLLKGIRSGAQRAIAYLQTQTRLAPPANPKGIGTGGAVNTGRFLGGWRSKAIPEGAVITNDRPYGPIVERGRRQGAKMPPAADIIAWIQRRLGKSREEAIALRFVISRAISRRGLLGRFIMTSNTAQAEIAKLVQAEMAHELEHAQGER